MELTGLPVLILALTVVVCAVVAAAAWLPRTGRGAVGFAARLGVLLVVSTLVVTTVGLVLNRENAWYASWSDLFGRGGAAESDHAGGPAKGVFTPQDTEAVTSSPLTPGAALPPLPTPGARVQVYRITGRQSRLTGEVRVYLPKGYEDPANAKRLYPVVLASHGYPSSPMAYETAYPINAITDPLVEKRQLAAPIFVAPALSFPGHDDSECTNGGPGIAQVETWAASDVTEFVRTHFRVRTGRSSWATLGYSFGGYCSALITMLHPKTFGSAIILGGYFRPTFPGALPYPRDGALARRYDLIALAKTRPPAVAMYVQTGPMDTPSWPTCREFFDVVRAPTSVTKIVDPTAGHRGSVWSAYLPKSLVWLGATAPGFAPAP